MRLLALILWFAASLASICQPPVEKRAFVTILTDLQDCLLKVRVLKKSLRRSASHADTVVIVPEFILNVEVEQMLAQDGIRIHTVTKELIKGVKQSDLREVLPLWAFELFQYDRVVYLDPFSLAIENMDVAFRCPGYCASPDSKYGPVVLQPLKDTYAYLLQLLKSGKRDILMELQWFYNLASCPAFTSYSDDAEEATPSCEPSDYKSSSLSSCHKLPVSLGVPSSYFSSSSVTNPLVCPRCGFDIPRLIVYPADESPYEAFLFTEKAIRWRWHDMRSTIAVTQTEVFSALIIFFPPLVAMLVILWSHRKGSMRAATPDTDSEIEYPARSIISPGTGTGSSSYSVWNLLQALAVLTMVSAWYRISRLLGVTMASSWWEPTTASSIVFVWMNMALLMGLQLIDMVYLAKKNGFRSLFIQGGLVAVIFLLLRHFLSTPQKYFPSIMVVLAMFLCRNYWSAQSSSTVREKALGRSPSLSDGVGAVMSINPPPQLPQQAAVCGPLVQKEDISILLAISLCYYLATGLVLFLPLPDTLKSIIIRLIAFLHATGVVTLYICIVYGQAAWVSSPSGRSDLVSHVCIYSPCRGNAMEGIDTKCCVLRRVVRVLWNIVKQPCVLLLLFLVSAFLFVFYMLFLERIPTLPSARPFFCLLQHDMYINPGGSLSTMCGAAEAMSLHDTGAWSETFSQHYMCLQAAPPSRAILKSRETESELSNFIQNRFSADMRGESLVVSSINKNNTRSRQRRGASKKANMVKYLNIRRGTSSSCSPETQFVFITVEPNQIAENKGFCIYSPRRGKFLSSAKEASDVCGKNELWHVQSTHTWTDAWSKVGTVISPLRYRFAYSYPLLTAVILVGLIFTSRLRHVRTTVDSILFADFLSLSRISQISTNYPVKASLALTMSMIAIYLGHVVIITLFIGSERYNHSRNMISHWVNSAQNLIGIPSGPQFLRLLVIHPEQCPETVWLLSLCVYSCGTVFLLLFLSTGMFTDVCVISTSGTKSPKRKTPVSSADEFADDAPGLEETDSDGILTGMRKIFLTDVIAPSSSDDISAAEDRHVGGEDSGSKLKSESNVPSRFSPMAIVVAYVVGALLIDAFVSLILPMHNLGYNKDGRPPCRLFEQRFHLLGYGHEYVDSVLIAVNILCHLATLHSSGKVHRISSLVLTALTYVLTWLTVECCYLTFALKIVITLLSWEYAVPKLAPLYERIIYSQ